MPELKPESRTAFARNKAVDFNAFDKDFQRWLRLLVCYVEEHGGIPVLTTQYRGQELGSWLDTMKSCPHTLTEGERTALRCIPGMYLTPAANPRREVLTDPDRAYLWNRLKLWADDPMSDPVTRRRLKFFYTHRKVVATPEESEEEGRDVYEPPAPETPVVEPRRGIAPVLQGEI